MKREHVLSAMSRGLKQQCKTLVSMAVDVNVIIITENCWIQLHYQIISNVNVIQIFFVTLYVVIKKNLKQNNPKTFILFRLKCHCIDLQVNSMALFVNGFFLEIVEN